MVSWTGPDTKPEPRVRDKTVYERFHARDLNCLCCGRWPVEAAHLLRGKNREDVLEGLVPLCRRCHEALDKEVAYIGDFGRRVTPGIVKGHVAAFLRSEAGSDHAAYLIRRLGSFGAEHYVQRLEGAV